MVCWRASCWVSPYNQFRNKITCYSDRKLNTKPLVSELKQIYITLLATPCLSTYSFHADLRVHTLITLRSQLWRWEDQMKAFNSQIVIHWGSPSCFVMSLWNIVVWYYICDGQEILMHFDVYYRLCREVDILLRSTCQGSVLLCLQGGFLVTPFDGMPSSSKFS